LAVVTVCLYNTIVVAE